MMRGQRCDWEVGDWTGFPGERRVQEIPHSRGGWERLENPCRGMGLAELQRPIIFPGHAGASVLHFEPSTSEEQMVSCVSVYRRAVSLPTEDVSAASCTLLVHELGVARYAAQ